MRIQKIVFHHPNVERIMKKLPLIGDMEPLRKKNTSQAATFFLSSSLRMLPTKRRLKLARRYNPTNAMNRLTIVNTTYWRKVGSYILLTKI
jgi:hypothetical protein